MLLVRLQDHLERVGGLSANQYGFRRGKSTLDAVRQLMRLVHDASAGTRTTRRIAAVILLDVRNAFNSARWDVTSRCMDDLAVPGYLKRVLNDYLTRRKLLANDREIVLTCGVPQGSVMGPTLWNMLYDQVLRCPFPEGVDRVAYADDVALVVTARTEDELVTKGGAAIRMFHRVLDQLGLELAPQKTEVIVMAGRRRLESIQFDVLGHRVDPKDSVKYLGIWLNKHRKFGDHIKKAAAKAQAAAGALTRLMANTAGPRDAARRIIASAAASMALYGAPVWLSAMEQARNRETFRKAQRPLTLGICAAYRTISTDAAQVISCSPPWDLVARARAERADGATKDEAEETLIERWQERWTSSQAGSWTRRLIPELKPWITRRHGYVTHWTTQMISGHGSFNHYLHRFRRRDSPDCPFCPGTDDTAEHTLFHCGRWDTERAACWREVGVQTPDTVMARMLRDAASWSTVEKFATQVIKKRAEECPRSGRRAT